MDEELEGALDTALDELRAARPAADFLPRLRAHVEAQPSRSPVQWWIPLTASASAVAAGVIVAALVRAPRHDDAVRMTPPEVHAVATDAAERLPAVAYAHDASGELRRTQAGRRVTRSVNAAVVGPDSDDFVLVPPGQLAAVGRLVAAINDGDERAAENVRRLERSPTEIVIEPIRIEPVVVDPLKESL